MSIFCLKFWLKRKSSFIYEIQDDLIDARLVYHTEAQEEMIDKFLILILNLLRLLRIRANFVTALRSKIHLVDIVKLNIVDLYFYFIHDISYDEKADLLFGFRSGRRVIENTAPNHFLQ